MEPSLPSTIQIKNILNWLKMYDVHDVINIRGWLSVKWMGENQQIKLSGIEKVLFDVSKTKGQGLSKTNLI